MVGAPAPNFKLCQISDAPPRPTSDPPMMLILFFYCLRVRSRGGGIYFLSDIIGRRRRGRVDAPNVGIPVFRI